jgi:hypothetical protein
MKNETRTHCSCSAGIGGHVLDAVNILTVERGLIHFFEELRILPEYERIRYGVLESDEVGIGISLSDSFCGGDDNTRLHLEFTLWGRSIRHEEFRTRFGKLAGKLPGRGKLIALPGGSRLVFTRLEAPLGTVFETEYLFGIHVVNGILFLEAELDLRESAFHQDDAPTFDDLIVEDRRLPLLALERAAGSYLRRRLKTSLEVELDSLSPLRRRGGAELRIRVNPMSSSPRELASRFPIFRPEFSDPETAPLAILPDTVTRDYLTVLCVY